MKAALTIAGSDSGGGAGIQADLKTFEAHRIFGTSVITAITAQNSVGVQAAMPIPTHMIAAQLKSILDDFPIKAAKTGMLFNAETIVTVTEVLKQQAFPLVVDPVMVATSGDPLLEPEALDAMRNFLLPAATLITPNLQETSLLCGGMPVRNRLEMEKAAAILAEMLPDTWILIKGGHLSDGKASDLLFCLDSEPIWLEEDFVESDDTHGTGCTLSAAITANLADGMPIIAAVKNAKQYVTGAIRQAWSGLGKGHGSLRHHYQYLPSIAHD